MAAPVRQETSADGSEVLIKLALYGIASLVVVGLVFTAVWLVVAVAIPLVVINLGLIFLVFGLTKAEWKRPSLAGSLLGAILLVVDLKLGWSTRILVSNLAFFGNFIPWFFVANLAAGLTSAYFLIRDALNARTSEGAQTDPIWRRRNLLTVAGLTLVGGVTVWQQYGSGSQPVAGENPSGAAQGVTEVLTKHDRREACVQSRKPPPAIAGGANNALQQGSELGALIGSWVGQYDDNPSDYCYEFAISQGSGGYVLRRNDPGTGQSPPPQRLLNRNGKLVVDGKEAEFYKREVPTFVPGPDGTLLYSDGVGTLRLRRVPHAEPTKSTQSSRITPLKINDNVSFPVVELPDSAAAAAINAYILKETWGTPDYDLSNLRVRLEKDVLEGLKSYEFKVRRNTPSQLVIDVTVCTGGAGIHCNPTSTFDFNLTTGEKTVQRGQ